MGYFAMKTVSLELLFLSIDCLVENRFQVADQEKYLLIVSQKLTSKIC